MTPRTVNELRASLRQLLTASNQGEDALQVRHRYDWPETHILWVETPHGGAHPLAMSLTRATEREACAAVAMALWDRLYAMRWDAAASGDRAKVALVDAALGVLVPMPTEAAHG